MWQDEDSAMRPLPLDRPQLVAIDVDGVLMHTDGTPGRKTIDALRQACQAGVRVVLATARPPRSTAKVYRTLQLDTLQINHNGAVIYDPVAEKVMFHRPMRGPIARQIIDAARRMDADVEIGVEVIDQFYADHRLKALEREPSVGDVAQQDGALDAALGGSVTKIMMLGSAQSVGEIQMELGQRFSKHVAFAYSHHRLIQVVAAGVDKGVALAKVAAHYGVPQDRVMAIGDAPNDVPMLKWAGLGIAVANAWEDVRRLADFIVPSNDDDGVAEAIRKHVLI